MFGDDFEGLAQAHIKEENTIFALVSLNMVHYITS